MSRDPLPSVEQSLQTLDDTLEGVIDALQNIHDVLRSISERMPPKVEMWENRGPALYVDPHA